MLKFTISTTGEDTPFIHYWEKCVGSCHAYTALRTDYQRQLEKVHKECGFEYVRFHGLLDDDMSVVVREPATSKFRYCFFNIDTIFDFILSIGMKPFIELGFMPEVLASSKTTCFHYKGNISQPAIISEWDTLITALVTHLVSRYGVREVREWYFEVWNEPNLSFFFEGKQSDYFSLYKHTAVAIKKVDSQLPVGGPATALNAWIPQFIAYCTINSVPLDFISTHQYPTDDPLWRNDSLEMEAFQDKIKKGGGVRYERGILKKMTERAQREAGEYPLYYTEWNSSAFLPDTLHDEPYSAAFAAKTIVDNYGLVSVYSFWTFTDIFEEGGQLPDEFHGGYGLQTVHGIPKPVYHTFEFLHKLGNRLISIPQEQKTVGMIITANGKELSILAYNHQVSGMPIFEENVELSFLHHAYKTSEFSLIDEMNGNAYRKWKEMDSPAYPNAAELQMLEESARIIPVSLSMKGQPENTIVTFKLPPHSVALIRLC